jgi:DNA helicase IV
MGRIIAGTRHPGPVPGTTRAEEIAAEQAHVDRAYARLAEQRDRVERWRKDLLLGDLGGTTANRFERDRLNDALVSRAAEFDVGDAVLCFGRLDRNDGTSFHLGRVSVGDDDGDLLVVDWRAPAAEAFYRATPLQPLGVVRRRHLLCRGPRVVGLDDDLLQVEVADDGQPGGDGDLVLVGEGALLAALAKRRTGRMGDIVATIQADQDRAVRAPLAGMLVVQGGPGTGKTAVALHRAAYLLYAERQVLQEQGILVVGPSPAFCRYVSQVLPSLGEEGVALATVADLAPARPTASEADDVARLKGDPRMAGFVAAAVATRQRALRRTAEVPHGAYVLRLEPEVTKEIVRAARRRRGNHNRRRRWVEEQVLGALWAALRRAEDRAARAGLLVDGAAAQAAFDAEIAALVGHEPGDDPHDTEAEAEGDAEAEQRAKADFVRDLRRQRAFKALLARIWPVLTPAMLLADLFGSQALLRAAARRSDLTEAEAASLHRVGPADGDEPAWTDADLPLLDEALELLGPVSAARRPSARNAGAPAEDDLAEVMVERVAADLSGIAEGLQRAVAERVRATIAADRAEAPAATEEELRTYGHVVVDEAQELSAMAWRMLRRRCPRRSFTIVGDLDQAGAPGAIGSWEDAAGTIGGPDLSVVTLTVNYRTPQEVMDLAAAAIGTAGTAVRSAREGGATPIVTGVAAPDLVTTTIRAVEALEAGDTGQVAVVAAPGHHATLAEALGTRPNPADISGHTRVLLDPRRAKGLEFDAVVVVEPAAILAASSSGRRDLYVALTRTTDRLTVVHAEPLPATLAMAAALLEERAGQRTGRPVRGTA